MTEKWSSATLRRPPAPDRSRVATISGALYPLEIRK